MNVAATVMQVLLGVLFLGSGGSKIAGAKTQVENFDRWRLPQWFRLVVGSVEIIGALGLLVGVTLHWVGTLAALWLGGVMLGALMTHIRIRDIPEHFAPPVVLLVVVGIVTALRWSSLGGHVL